MHGSETWPMKVEHELKMNRTDFNCQKFGHGKKTCKGKEICAKCGQAGHSGSPCSNAMKCPNCAGIILTLARSARNGSSKSECNK